MSVGKCEGCGEHSLLMPLHGGKGGPLRCPICVGKWNAEHGRRRRAGRVVIRAIKAFWDAGGGYKDIDKLKLSACADGGLPAPTIDPLGYMTDIARLDGADADITSELLAATIALTHPDKHPPERKAEAHRVTQALLALKPFVFPAPKPKPPPKPGDVSSNRSGDELNKPSRPAYPCVDCSSTISDFYCDACKAQWEKEQQQKREIEEQERVNRNARQRERYRLYRAARRRGRSCATCGESFKPMRSDMQYCSAKCRQRAYVKRDGNASNSRPLGPEHIERVIESAFIDNPDSAFTTDELCRLVYPGLRRIERKHRAAVVPVAKKISERMGKHRTWFQAEQRGGPLVFFNHASVTSYALARLRAHLFSWSWSEERLKAEIAPGGRDHHLVVEGGAWWKHCQGYVDKQRAAA
jgi:hypothetical protein